MEQHSIQAHHDQRALVPAPQRPSESPIHRARPLEHGAEPVRRVAAHVAKGKPQVRDRVRTRPRPQAGPGEAVAPRAVRRGAEGREAVEDVFDAGRGGDGAEGRDVAEESGDGPPADAVGGDLDDG